MPTACPHPLGHSLPLIEAASWSQGFDGAEFKASLGQLRPKPSPSSSVPSTPTGCQVNVTNFKQDQSTTAVSDEVTSLKARHGGHCGTRVRQGFLPRPYVSPTSYRAAQRGWSLPGQASKPVACAPCTVGILAHPLRPRGSKNRGLSHAPSWPMRDISCSGLPSSHTPAPLGMKDAK